MKVDKIISDEIINKIQKALAKESKIVVAYILGSFVKGEISNKSDFDLVVYVKDKTVTYEQVYKLIQHIQFPRNLDLSLVTKSSSPLFLFQTISKGIKIYTKSAEEGNAFEAYVLRRYYDTEHTRAIYSSYLKNKFSTDHHAS